MVANRSWRSAHSLASRGAMVRRAFASRRAAVPAMQSAEHRVSDDRAALSAAPIRSGP